MKKIKDYAKRALSLLLVTTLVLGSVPESTVHASEGSLNSFGTEMQEVFNDVKDELKDTAEGLGDLFFNDKKDAQETGTSRVLSGGFILGKITSRKRYDSKRGLIVKYKDNCSTKIKNSIRKGLDGISELKGSLTTDSLGSLHLKTGFSLFFEADSLGIDVFMAESESEVSKLKKYLEGISGVEYVQEDYELEVTALPVNEEFPLQWYARNSGQKIEGNTCRAGVDLNLLSAWELTEGSPDVVVGILDSGIDINHENLKNAIWVNPGEIAGNGIDDDNNGYIDDINGWDFSGDDNSVYDGPESDKHGTTIAGLIAGVDTDGEIKGVASGVKVMPLKFINGSKGYTSDAIRAINYAKSNGVTLVNCSFSGSDNNKALCDAMKDSGILFVCGAGNSAKDTSETPVYPASFDLDNIISVASVDMFGVLADFSAYGPDVDIAAPGLDIRTAIPENGYGYVTGTSASAALITGLLALGKSYLPDLTYEQLKQRLFDYSTECTNLKDKVRYGRADAYGLLTGNKKETDDYEGPGVASGLTPYVGEDADTWYVVNELASGVERFHYGNSGVYPSSGNYSASFTDRTLLMSGKETISFKRTYNSKDDTEGLFGRGFRSSVEGCIKDDGKYVTVVLPTGSNVYFKKEDNGSYTGLYSRAKLVKESGCFIYKETDLTEYRFNSKNKLYCIADRYGNEVTITYSKDKPVIIRDVAGRGFDLSYNEDGRVSALLSTDGTEVKYSYNKKKLLSKVTYPSGTFMSFTYDNEKYLSKVTDGEGRDVISLSYSHGQGDAKDKVTSFTDENGGIYTLTYDEKSRKTTIKKESKNNAKTYVYYYDGCGQETSIVDPDGLIEKFEYTYESAEKYYGDLRSHTDRYGNITSFEIDDDGNIIKTTYPDGSIVRNTYDAFHNKLSEVTAEGKTTYYSYSKDGRFYLGTALALKEGTDHESAVSAIANFASGAAVTSETVNSYSISSVSYVSDSAIGGLVEYMRDPAGDITKYSYDEKGNLLTESRSFFGVNRVFATYTYDEHGNRTSFTDGEGNAEKYEYNADGQITKTIAKDGGTTLVTYDGSGLVTRKTAPGEDNNYTYAKNGKVATITDIQGTVSSYTYDDEGKVSKETDVNGATYLYEYDNLGRVVKKFLVTDKETKVLAEYSYEKNAAGGIVTTEKDYLVGEDEIKDTISNEKDGADKAADYVVKVAVTDCMGRVVSEYLKGEKNDTNKKKTIYDKDGNVSQVIRPDGSMEITERDLAGRVIRTYEPQSVKNGVTLYKRTDTELDSAGRTVSTRVYTDNVTYGGTSERYTLEKYYYEDGCIRYQEVSGKDYTVSDNGELSVTDVEPVITALASDTNGNVLRTFSGKKEKLDTALLATETGTKGGKTFVKADASEFVSDDSIIIDYEYDETGRETLKKTYAAKTDNTTDAPIIIRHEYNTAGDVTLYDENGDVISYTYDYKKGSAESTSKLFNDNGDLLETVRVFAMKNSAGHITEQKTIRTKNDSTKTYVSTYRYDVFGNACLITDPEGGITLSRYNWLGGQTLKVSANNYEDGKDPYTLSRTEFSYGTNGQVVSERIYDASKDVSTPATFHTFKYDRSGNLTDTLDAFGNGTKTTYYPNGKKASEKTARQQAKNKSGKTYDYDVNGNIISEKDSYGEKVSVYNNYGSLLRESILEKGKAEAVKGSYTYDHLRRCVRKIDALGLVSSYTYDNLGRCLKAVSGEGETALITTYFYNEKGNMIRQENNLGMVSEKRYDSKNNTIYTEIYNIADLSAEKTSESACFDLLGNKISQTSASGVETTYEYDGLNRLTKENLFADTTKTTSYAYDKEGNKVKATDWRGNESTLTYDTLGRLVCEKNALGDAIRTISYDKAGREILELDGEGNKTFYSYDADGNLYETKDELGGSTKTTYDYRGRLKKKVVKITESSSSTDSFYYDAADDLIGVSDSYGNYTEYVYDNAGNLLKQINAAGYETSYEYDKFGRLVKRIDPNGKSEIFTYRADGLMLSKVSKGGDVTRYTYDGFGRTVREEVTGKNGTKEAKVYTYDALGNVLTCASEKNGIETSLITYTYDKENRVTSKKTEGVGEEEFVYDTIDDDTLLVQKKMRDKNGVISVSFSAYDKINRVETIIDGDGSLEDNLEALNSGIPDFSTTCYYAYDKRGAKSREMHLFGFDKTEGTPTELTFDVYKYDKAGNNVKIDHEIETKGIVASESYEYDLNHNVIKETRISKDSEGNEKQIVIDYEYDLLGQLTKVTEKDKTTEYTYDTIGNRTAEVVTYADVKLGKVVTLYKVDAAGRLLSTDCSNGVHTSYGYDGSDNVAIVAKSQKRQNTALETSGILLVEETDEYGNTISPASGSAVSATLDALTITYSYDLFNRLTESKAGKKITGFTYTADDYRLSKTDATGTIVYFYEGDKVAFEEDANGAVSAVNHVGTSTYARTIFEEGAETTFYYRFNAYGDVTALTGTDGSLIAEYEYDAFGNLTSQPDSKVNNSITYRGYEYDAETGLYYLNARYYDSTTARFLTEDTYRGEKNDPLSLNLYTYCKNNPLKYTDPTGHNWVPTEMSGGTNNYNSNSNNKGIKEKRNTQLSDDIVSLLRGATLIAIGVTLCVGAGAVGTPLFAYAAYTAATASLSFGLSDISQGADGISKYSSTEGEYSSNNFIRDYGFNGNEGAYISAEMFAVDVGDFSVNYGDDTWKWIKGLANKYYNKAKNVLNRVFGSNNTEPTIPEKVFSVLDDIKKNNGAPPKGYKGGRVYKNIPVAPGAQKLPEGLTYREYDVNPYIKGQNRGTERLVIGSDGSVWYTNNHYFTFERVE